MRRLPPTLVAPERRFCISGVGAGGKKIVVCASPSVPYLRQAPSLSWPGAGTPPQRARGSCTTGYRAHHAITGRRLHLKRLRTRREVPRRLGRRRTPSRRACAEYRPRQGVQRKHLLRRTVLIQSWPPVTRCRRADRDCVQCRCLPGQRSEVARRSRTPQQAAQCH
jgi:hypothetical protein